MLKYIHYTIRATRKESVFLKTVNSSAADFPKDAAHRFIRINPCCVFYFHISKTIKNRPTVQE